MVTKEINFKVSYEYLEDYPQIMEKIKRAKAKRKKDK